MTTPSTPGDYAAAVAESDLPAGDDERFAGYGIMAQPFRSGHVLALRRFPHTSIGAAYTSVWHCDPDGRWTMWNDAPPLASCPRFFGPALAEAHECPIELQWLGPWQVHVHIDGVLDWDTTFGVTPSTWMMSAIGTHLANGLWRNPAFLAAMGPMAGVVLRAGAIRFRGDTPSRQWFRVQVPHVWAVKHVEATLRGKALGPAGATHPQRWLGGFALPNRGLFAIGRVTIERYEPDKHLQLLPAG